MRGLKLSGSIAKAREQRSHLLQMRGLKPANTGAPAYITKVASFTDAWIETGERPAGSKEPVVASFTDAWIETKMLRYHLQLRSSHLLQMRGLKRF